MAYMESEVLNLILNSNSLVLQVLDIFILRVMNKVAWIVQFKQLQLETPYVSVLPVMSIRNENHHQQSILLLENMKAEIILICWDRTCLIKMGGTCYPNEVGNTSVSQCIG